MDTKSTKVSVIIPAYNQAVYLGEAIQSALNQTYQDREIIVVNDGSTDNTSEIASHYKHQIIYISQRNLGLSGARNTAIKIARGEFIALLDSDDVWLPGFLEKTVAVLSQNPRASMVYCGHRYIDSHGNEIGIPVRKVVPPDQAYQALMMGGNWIVPSAVVFRKNFASEMGLFDEEIGPVADTDLWVKLSLKGSLIGTPEALIKYRRHESNMSKNPTVMVNASLKCLDKRYGPLDENNDNRFRKKNSYRKLFQSAICKFLAFGDLERSVEYYIQLMKLDFTSSISLPVWRSFCRANIPLEFNNDPTYVIDFERMESTVLRFLDEIDNHLEKTQSMKSMQHKIRISAYLALAEEGRIAGNFRFFWNYLSALLTLDTKRLFSRPFWGRVLRYILGKLNILKNNF